MKYPNRDLVRRAIVNARPRRGEKERWSLVRTLFRVSRDEAFVICYDFKFSPTAKVPALSVLGEQSYAENLLEHGAGDIL